MISFLRAWESHAEQGANKAAVCSSPPSEVGVGTTEFDVSDASGEVSGRK